MVLKGREKERVKVQSGFGKMEKLFLELTSAVYQWKDRLKKKTDLDFQLELDPEKKTEFDNEIKSYDKGKNKIVVKSDSVFGINNIGNTCFFNSTIQCLNSNRKLVEYYIKNSEDFGAYTHVLPYGAINHKFSLFLEMANSGKKNSTNPKSLFKSLIAM